MSKTIVFFGNERLATGVSTTAPALRALIDAGYEVAAIVVAQSDAGKSRRPRELEVAEIARQNDIPLLSPVDLSQAKDELSAYGAQAAVLIAYGKIVPSGVLGIFPAGIVNIHPSLLPLCRGSTPIESAILSGVVETGVSLMKLIEKMDAGPVYDRRTVQLSGSETKQDLADKLSGIGKDMLLEYMPAILDGSAEPTPQASGATSSPHISKTNGVIDWSKPAALLEREVRAYAGWPRSRAELNGIDVIITKATVSDEALKPGEIRSADKRLVTGCGEGSLEILSLVPAGKREMTAEAFLAGYQL